MPRKIRIVTTSLATLEDFQPPYNLRHPDPDETLALGLSMLEAAGAQGADLALLPESFMGAVLPGRRIAEVAQPIPGPAFDRVAAVARKHRMYVVAGFFEKRGDLIRNVAALIDREGRLAGLYAKRHPTDGEIAGGVTPGADVPVFDTDFGRIGIGICFDINWPDFWAELKRKGAELVCWLSAYEGGFPLQSYAWQHQFAVVTSVWPYNARIIERTGRITAQTSRWGRLGIADLDLEKRLYHTDGHYPAIMAMQARYGRRIRIETLGEEHMFTLESLDPTLSLDEVAAEFKLTPLGAFIDRCTAAQAKARAALETV
jgi:predicted amidohydrolase